MEEGLALLLIDNSNNLIEEINIKKPKTYDLLLNIIQKEFKNLPKHYIIYYQNGKNNEIINNNEQYKLAKDILFIKDNNNKKQSIFSLNYNKLSESKQEILDEKYSCNICQENIKNIIDGKPLMCYQCQKIFHKKCLENWDNKCSLSNIKFNCPKCKYDLPLKHWKEKVNYEDERINEANKMNELNNNKLKENIYKINDNKYNKLKNEYLKYIEDSLETINNIFHKVQEIQLLINNNILNTKDKEQNKNINELSNKIFELLKIIDIFIQNKSNDNSKKEEIIKVNHFNNILLSDLNNKIVDKNINSEKEKEKEDKNKKIENQINEDFILKK